MATPVVESYIETIYNLTMEGEQVIAARLVDRYKVRPPSVSETLHRMEEQGFIAFDAKRHILLTVAGRELAESGLRRHRLLERMLVDLFHLDWVAAHEEAHHLEHGLSERLEQAMSTSLGEPLTCPHGNPIPAPGRDPTSYLRDMHACRLTEAPVAVSLSVVCVSEVVEDETALLRSLDELTIRPGRQLSVLQHGSATCAVDILGTRVELARGIAEKLWVHDSIWDVQRTSH